MFFLDPIAVGCTSRTELSSRMGRHGRGSRTGNQGCDRGFGSVHWGEGQKSAVDFVVISMRRLFAKIIRHVVPARREVSVSVGTTLRLTELAGLGLRATHAIQAREDLRRARGARLTSPPHIRLKLAFLDMFLDWLMAIQVGFNKNGLEMPILNRSSCC